MAGLDKFGHQVDARVESDHTGTILRADGIDQSVDEWLHFALLCHLV
jgi:hypothetical protein